MTREIKMISRDELADLICSEKNVRVVDVLDWGHFNEEHIVGAISIPLDELEGRARKVLGRDDTIVVYCASFDCQASTNAARKLMSMGFTHVLDYKGGLKDYKEARWPLESGLHPERARAFPCESFAR